MTWILFLLILTGGNTEGRKIKEFDTLEECQTVIRAAAPKFSFNSTSLTCIQMKEEPVDEIEAKKQKRYY